MSGCLSGVATTAACKGDSEALEGNEHRRNLGWSVVDPPVQVVNSGRSRAERQDFGASVIWCRELEDVHWVPAARG